MSTNALPQYSLTQMKEEEFKTLDAEFKELLEKYSAFAMSVPEFAPLEQEQGAKIISKIVFLKKVEIPAKEGKSNDTASSTATA